MTKILFHPRRALQIVGLLLACHIPAFGGTVNIEIDYMEDKSPGGHSHKPQSNEIAAVVQMFACHGHTLNIVVDQSIPHFNVMPRDPDNVNNFFEYYGDVASFGLLKTLYFGHAGQPNWHYCIFAHDYADTNGVASGSSGLGQRPGLYFVVTLGSFDYQIGTPFDRAATLAHEFGHNLGLTHGAYGNFPPNKPSIMSYFYQLAGVRTGLLDAGLTSADVSLFKEIDYSNGTMCPLNESLLNEQFGTGMVPVDWNCDGIISGSVSKGIDDSRSWCNKPGLDRNILQDVDEWSIVPYFMFGSSFRSTTQKPATESCITYQEYQNFKSLHAGARVQPAVISEPCISAKMVYLSPGASPSGSGVCADPCTTLGIGQAVATPGSQLFLLPGTYTLDSGPVHLNKPMTLNCKIGTAVLSAH